MSPLSSLGKFLILIGGVFILLGLVFLFGNKIPFAGRLPGDIYIQRKNFSFYFPLTTSIIVSVILTIIFSLWNRR